MILKIDHLAFSSSNLDEDLKIFQSLGYNAQFVEKNLNDLENKRPFMKHFTGQLDMALMTRKGSISVELINHGHVVDEGLYILPILEGTSLDLERIEESFALQDCSFVKARSNLLRAEFFIPDEENATEFRCNKVVVDAGNIRKAVEFWGSLGFKPVAVGEQNAHLEFRSPFTDGAYQLYIRKGEPRPNQSFLDTRGFNCVAFISTDAEKERQRFEQLGVRPTETNPFRVNGKDLRIFWLQGPCGEIVEVIGLAK